ncbi:CocE/NonD family hydrolase [Dactylosporangium sp. CS-047395]|uniref:CocE/NonD family hydrolase n=1 Tax=Dactylosporangium sp. CS-047395 TaxID=3239936 RepID=UPI003D949B05
MRLDPVGRLLKLPPAVTARVKVTRAIPIRMRDGANLRADHYAPAIDAEVPTVLVRTPYGRGAPVNLLCRAVAQRGFHVLIQSCRGTADSSGTFEPLLQEREDGLDTLDWLRLQPWYDGRLLTYGPSYVGFVQWALAAEAGDELKAMATIVTASDFGPPTYAGGAFSLDTVLTWSALLEAQRGPRLENAVELLRGQPRLQRGLARVPMAEADRVTVGAEIEFFQRWLAEADPAAPYWTERGHTHRLPNVTAPVLMIGGWYDIFLPWQLVDYVALRAAGQHPHLTIGPWHHGSAGLFQQSAAEAVAWFRAHTGGPEQVRDRPVRVHVGGAEGWLELADWPPPSSTPQRWYLSKSATLTLDDPRTPLADEAGWPTPTAATHGGAPRPRSAGSSPAAAETDDELGWPSPTPAAANAFEAPHDEHGWPTRSVSIGDPHAENGWPTPPGAAPDTPAPGPTTVSGVTSSTTGSGATGAGTTGAGTTATGAGATGAGATGAGATGADGTGPGANATGMTADSGATGAGANGAMAAGDGGANGASTNGNQVPDEAIGWPVSTESERSNGRLDWPSQTMAVAADELGWPADTPDLPGGDVLDSFIYDPKNPTPALGGPRLVGKIAGRRDNRPLESRPDVLTFTSPPLAEPLTVVGPVSADITVRATTAGRDDDTPAPYFDLFVRLCEVDEQGRSWNICDGLTRARPDRDPTAPVRVELWPTAHRFEANRRIRIQVSGGAHPRFSRNPGTGAPFGHELELRKVRQEILSPSYVTLPLAR